MPPQSYNFFGLAPAQQQAPPDPSLLALQQFNNPTSAQGQPSQGGGINPQALAKMMMHGSNGQPNGNPMASDGLQVGQLYNGGNLSGASDMPTSMPTSSPGLWAQLSGMFGGGNGGS